MIKLRINYTNNLLIFVKTLTRLIRRLYLTIQQAIPTSKKDMPNFVNAPNIIEKYVEIISNLL